MYTMLCYKASLKKKKQLQKNERLERLCTPTEGGKKTVTFKNLEESQCQMF